MQNHPLLNKINPLSGPLLLSTTPPPPPRVPPGPSQMSSRGQPDSGCDRQPWSGSLGVGQAVENKGYFLTQALKQDCILLWVLPAVLQENDSLLCFSRIFGRQGIRHTHYTYPYTD